MTEQVPAKKQTSGLTRILGWLVNKLWLTFAFLIILTATLFILLRLALPSVDNYRENIVEWLENKYDVNINVDKLAAEWGATGPVITATNFTVRSENGQFDSLTAKKVSVAINALDSLRFSGFYTDEIQIADTNIEVYLDRRLGIRLSPVKVNAKEELPIALEKNSQFVINTIFGQNDVSIVNSRLKIKTLSGRSINYELQNLSVKNFGDIHQLSGQIKDSQFGHMDLVAELHGDPKTSDSRAEVYLAGRQISLTQLPFILDSTDLPMQKGKMNWQAWARWQDGKWQQARGTVALSNISWKNDESADSSAALADIDKLSMDWGWQFSSDTQGHFAIDNIKVLRRGAIVNEGQNAESETIQFPPIEARFDASGFDHVQWTVSLNDWQLSSILPYLTLVLPDNSQIEKFLRDAKPELFLDNASLTIERKSGLWINPQLRADFSQLRYGEFSKLPLVSDLSGHLQLNKGKLILDLYGEDIQLAFGDLFRNTIYAEKLHSQIEWTLPNAGGAKENEDPDTANSRIAINEFSLSNEDLSLVGRGQIFSQDGRPELDLYAELSDINAAQKSKYLPTGIMQSSLVNYLDRSIRTGNISLVKALLRGPLEDFPYYQKTQSEGIFSILGKLENSEFAYLPDWPVAEGLSVDMLFEGNGMNLLATSAKSAGNLVKSARAVIKDFSATNTPFDLYLNIDSMDNQGQLFLEKSPLQNLAKALKHFRYQGRLNTQLEMHLGLSDSSDINMSGEVTLGSQNSLQFDKLELNDVDGKIRFNENGLTQSQLKANLYGAGFDASLSGGVNPDDPKIKISFSSRLTPELMALYPGKFWQKYFTGSSDLSGLILVGPKENRSASVIHIQSSGEGLGILLPDGLAKKPKSKSELLFSIDFGEQTSRARINFGTLAGVWQWHKEDKFPIAESMFYLNQKGQLPENLPENLPKGVNVRADFDQFDLEEWWPFYQKIGQHYGIYGSKLNPKLASDHNHKGNDDQNANSNISDAKDSAVIGKIELSVDELVNPIFDLKQLSLGLTQNQKGELFISVDGVDSQGYLVVKENAPWKIDFKQLKLVTKDWLDKQKRKQQASSVEEQLSETKLTRQGELEKVVFWGDQLPDINLRCGDCRFNTKPLGELKLKVRPTPGRITISGSLVDGGRHNVQMSGSWTQLASTQQEISTAKNARVVQSTELAFVGKTNDLHQLLKRWEYPIAVADSDAKFSAKMKWTGAPWQIDLLTMEGQAVGELGKGYLSEVSDSGARIFSLFNIQSLTNKLRLDFKDVYKKGFFFDKLTGTVTLKDGVLYTGDTFIDGNAANVSLSGRIDLNREEVEQIATVNPKLTSSLPVLVGWAVEPTTGLLVFLLNKLMEPAIDVVTQIDYRIHGPLSNTKVEQISRKRQKVKFDVPKQDASKNNDATLAPESNTSTDEEKTSRENDHLQKSEISKKNQSLNNDGGANKEVASEQRNMVEKLRDEQDDKTELVDEQRKN